MSLLFYVFFCDNEDGGDEEEEEQSSRGNVLVYGSAGINSQRFSLMRRFRGPLD